MSMCFNFVLQTKATASGASAVLPLASFLAPSLVHAGPKDEAAALKMGIAFARLKRNYLRAIYMFVINLAHYFLGTNAAFSPTPPPDCRA